MMAVMLRVDHVASRFNLTHPRYNRKVDYN